MAERSWRSASPSRCRRRPGKPPDEEQVSALGEGSRAPAVAGRGHTIHFGRVRSPGRPSRAPLGHGDDESASCDIQLCGASRFWASQTRPSPARRTHTRTRLGSIRSGRGGSTGPVEILGPLCGVSMRTTSDAGAVVQHVYGRSRRREDRDADNARGGVAAGLGRIAGARLEQRAELAQQIKNLNVPQAEPRWGADLIVHDEDERAVGRSRAAEMPVEDCDARSADTSRRPRWWDRHSASPGEGGSRTVWKTTPALRRHGSRGRTRSTVDVPRGAVALVEPPSVGTAPPAREARATVVDRAEEGVFGEAMSSRP